jgi:hypothetical protein
VTVRDFYLPYFRADATEAEQMRVGRAFTVVWGTGQIAVAYAAQNVQSALQDGLAVLGYASRPDGGRVPAGGADAIGDGAGHPGGDGGRPGGQPAGLASGRRGLDLERGRGAVTTFTIGLGLSALRPSASPPPGPEPTPAR